MALQALFSPFLVSPTILTSLHPPKSYSRTFSSKSIRCVTNKATTDHPTVNRRSANYQPSVWDYDFLKSLGSDYTDEKYGRQVDEMKEEVKSLMKGNMTPLVRLELIDNIQRLGLKYQFETEIKESLGIVYRNGSDAQPNDDIYATALRFRLLRQHGYTVAGDVFVRFKDETNNFRTSLCDDVKGLLSLYEASFLGLEGETIIDEAKAFSTAHLRNIKQDLSPSLARKVGHALDMPLHWRSPRMEARWFIDAYEEEPDMNPTLLQLAKLDYNMVQLVHQKEVGRLASWWVDTGLDKLSFSRDRLVEHYVWCNAMVFQPQYGPFRHMVTKIASLVTVLDDIYDVYGCLEELELFTDFVDRWDINGIDKLPVDIRACLLAMYNTTNEIGYWILRERGVYIIPHLGKIWGDQCKAYLKEARWYHGGYKPMLNEYLDNAAISIGVTNVLICCYFLTTDKITKEALSYIDNPYRITATSSLLVRLTNDLATSSHELARGDTLKSIQCYMNETGTSEEEARTYINKLIHETWRTLNKNMLEKFPFSKPALNAHVNIVRNSHRVYQHGDGHGVPGPWTKDHHMELLVRPIPLN